MDVSKGGHINCDGYKVYLSGAFAGYAVGLQGFDRGYRVWFFNVQLGTFIPGVHETLQPVTVHE